MGLAERRLVVSLSRRATESLFFRCGGNIRELSIVLYVVLEVPQLLDDLLSLVYTRLVRGLGTGAVGIVDGLCLRGNQAKVSKWPRRAACRMEQGPGRQTMITGHRSRAVVQPKEVLSAVE